MGKLRLLASKVKSPDLRRVKPMPKRADPELRLAAHRVWAEAVIARAGHRCEAILDDGSRCPERRRLVADHIVERADGGAPLDTANGQCLCVAHNTAKGIAARVARRG